MQRKLKRSFERINVVTFLLFFASIVSNSIFLCRATVFCIFLMSLILSRSERFTVNPMLLFCITPFSLLIYVNIGDVYMVNLQFKTWLIAIINMYSFIIAYNYTSEIKECTFCIGNSNIRSLQKQSVLFYMISLFGNLIEPIAYIVWMFSIASIVCALKTRKKSMLFFVLIIFIVSAIDHTSKSTMLTYCITFIICFEKYYIEDEKKRRWVNFALGIGVIFMVFAFSFANKGREKNGVDETVDLYSSRGIEWNYDKNLFMPYMYLTNGWTNLQYVLETQDTRTFGLWTIRPILGYCKLKDKFKNKYRMVSYSTFNTYAYMTYGFKDFGYWCSSIMSLFLGFYVKRVYSRYKLSRSPYDVSVYVLVAQATFELFFSNHFFTQSYPFTILILMVLVKLYMKKKNQVEIEEM